jgi:ferredoxin
MVRTRFEVVEDDCVACGLCEERAPANLRIPPGQRAATVVKQPEDDAETRACRDAADYCPMGALQPLNPR